MSSFCSSSAANPFVLRGAKIVFVDIRPDTMNMNEELLEEAVTEKTRVIVPFHYAGVACDMKHIMEVAKKYNLYVVENVEHGLMGKYFDDYLGTMGDLGCVGFHEGGSYACGQGGALFINRKELVERAEWIRDEGTNRNLSEVGFQGYSWVDIGSSYRISELNAAYLYSQLGKSKILYNRIRSWDSYYRGLKILETEETIELPQVIKGALHNGSIFYMKLKDSGERTRVMKYLQYYKVETSVHYKPLHSSPAGGKYSRFSGQDRYTTAESKRLLLLPLYYGLDSKDVKYIVNTILMRYSYKFSLSGQD